MSEEKGRAGELTYGRPELPQGRRCEPPAMTVGPCTPEAKHEAPSHLPRAESEIKPPALSVVSSQVPSHVELGLLP